ncbi:MAG: hypothetical protein ACRDGD_07295 [Candidatus Limnocylindria bacterium]
MAELAVRRAEKRLDEWLRQVDRPVDGLAGTQMVPIALAMRARDLFRGYRHCLSGPSLPSAAVVLRAIADLAILTLWLEGDPEARTECWFAEDDRQSIVGVTRLLR